MPWVVFADLQVAGVGLMKLNDIDGATAAFGRFEIDFASADYPRPDFDAVYNLARLSTQLGDAIDWAIARMWVWLKAPSRLEPRWPEVPKTTLWPGSPMSGTTLS